RQALPGKRRRPVARGQESPGERHAELDELSGRDAAGLEGRLYAAVTEAGLAGDRRRVTPHVYLPFAGSGGDRHRRGEALELHLPFRPPHLQVDIDVVVVHLGEPFQDIADLERPLLVGGVVVPHDAHAAAEVANAEGAGRRLTTQVGAPAVDVHHRPLGDGNAAERFAGGEGDLPIGAREGAVEV